MGDRSADGPLVAVVDDQRDVRTTIGRGLMLHGLRCHPLASGQDLLDALQYLEPDCILLDFRMPGLDGIETIKAIPETRRRIPILFFTSHGDIPLAVEAMQLGAVDFIEKPCPLEQIATKIKAAIAATKKPGDLPFTFMQATQIISKLTDREREILRFVSEGLQNKQIAVQLDLSVRTVESHRHHAIRKIGDPSLVNVIRLFQAADGG